MLATKEIWEHKFPPPLTSGIFNIAAVAKAARWLSEQTGLDPETLVSVQAE